MRSVASIDGQFLLLMFLAAAPGLAAANDRETQATPEHLEFFEKKVRPLFVQHCYSCHSNNAKTLHGGLKLDSAEGLQTGGDSGVLVVPEKPDASLLIEVVRYEGDIQMPPKGKLSDREIGHLVEWVRRGAVSPSGKAAAPAADKPFDLAAAREFWSFRDVRRHDLPAVAHREWPLERIDYFILARMEAVGLSPSRAADRATLLRRLSFDLTGLPPSPEEVAEFVNDHSTDAYERQVDRLLNSPHYGERWARVWLDLARYTDKTATWLNSTGQAHLYRDWVVRSLNEDLPYDQFVRRQLATDLMEETGPGDLPALGFLGLSPNYWKELKLPSEIIKVIVADEWEERVDAVSRTFLGLTVACARCHDHKFDPITMRDYYALAGVFASSRISERAIISHEAFAPVKRAREQVAKLEKELAGLKKKKPQPAQEIAQVTEQIAGLKSTPHFNAPMAPAVIEEALFVERQGKTPQEGTKLVYRPEPRDLRLFIRGNPNRLGEVIPRRYIEVLSLETTRDFQQGSGRLELARAITRDSASLAARVMVNRVWQILFGRGIVATPSNFGQSGSRPSHPELLDDLAARFIAQGWSLKTLQRELVLSATYRQSSRTSSAQVEQDPDNLWWSRMNRRRLDVEAWRDAMLVAAGELDTSLGGPSVALTASNNHRRTLYGTIHRREMSTMLLTHDFPDPTAHSPQRQQTTTALQGLYVLNGPLLLDRAAALSARLQRECSTDEERIRLAYRLLYSREPSARETAIGLAFLEAEGSADRNGVWAQYAHVLLASNSFLFVN